MIIGSCLVAVLRMHIFALFFSPSLKCISGYIDIVKANSAETDGDHPKIEEIAS